MNTQDVKALFEALVAQHCQVSTVFVSDWAKQWYDTYVANRCITKKSAAMYRQKLKNYIIPSIGNMAMGEVTELHLQSLINNANSSKSTAQKVKIVVQAMFRRAKACGFILTDPSEHLTLPKAPQGTHRSITDTERKEIMELAERHYAGLYVLTLLLTGIRPGEAIALRWDDINFEERTLTICRAVESGTDTVIKEPKTAAGIRTIPIPDYLYERLQCWKGEESDPVFRQPTTGRMHSGSSANDLWNNFKRELDIQMGAEIYRNKIIRSVVATDLVPYCLRHTYCTDLQRAGVPINIAKYLMGHSDISVTSNIYTSTTPDVISNAKESIDNFYSGL